VAAALGACWANAPGLKVSVPKAAARSHFLMLDCMGLLSESCWSMMMMKVLHPGV